MPVTVTEEEVDAVRESLGELPADLRPRLEASWFAGQLVAQILAEATNATEEYIAVFMMVFLFAFIFTIVFFIVQFRADPVRAANTAARWSLAAFGVFLIGLVAMTAWLATNFEGAKGDMRVIAGLVLPGVAIILVLMADRALARRASEAASSGRDAAE